MKKYKLGISKRNDSAQYDTATKSFRDVELHRVVALKDFSDVKKGDVGGWVESESNLSHEGLCWIYHDAIAIDGANVSGNAILKHESQVTEAANISDNASMSGTSSACGESSISGHVDIRDDVKIVGASYVYGDTTRLSQESYIADAEISGGVVKGSTRFLNSAATRCGQPNKEVITSPKMSGGLVINQTVSDDLSPFKDLFAVDQLIVVNREQGVMLVIDDRCAHFRTDVLDGVTSYNLDHSDQDDDTWEIAELVNLIIKYDVTELDAPDTPYNKSNLYTKPERFEARNIIRCRESYRLHTLIQKYLT